MKSEASRLCAFTVAGLEVASLVHSFKAKLTEIGEELCSSVDDRLLYSGIIGLVIITELIADCEIVRTDADAADSLLLLLCFSHLMCCVKPFLEGFVHRAEHVSAEDGLGSGVYAVALAVVVRCLRTMS